jgi:enoyl-CoA hydratase/carnithine racemase
MHFVAPADLRGMDARTLDELLGRSDLLVAAGADDVRGLAAAALLFADYAVLDAAATLRIEQPETWAGAAWRIGRGALLLHLEQRTMFSASEAKAYGLCDEIIEGDAQVWLDRWMQGRSPAALDSAAALIRHRGGDALERVEFARLFATGEPQQGLRAFLARRSNFV